jgi:hypothetical protein
MDNDMHARFQRMLLGEPEPEPPKEPQAKPGASSASPPSPESLKHEPESESLPSQPPRLPPFQASQQKPPQPPQQYVDVNANLVPSPPAATPPSASATTRHLPQPPLSMVSIIQDQWLQLCDYFQRVQCANSAEERNQLVRELGIVEDSLRVIIDALLTDRKQFVSTQLLHTHASIFGESLHGSDAGMPTSTPAGETASGVSPTSSAANAHLRAGAAVAAAAATMTTPAPSPTSGFLLDGALTSLPPCYRFLFADAHRDIPPSSGDSDDGEGESVAQDSDGNGHQNFPATPPVRQGHLSNRTHIAMPFDEPSPIGSIFLLTLCQYAKQDQPPGVRSIILEFLVRLLQEADLPTDRAAYPAGDPVLSLLQLNPPLLIVPLLDMLRKVSKALDPSSTALKHGNTSMSSSLAYPWTGDEWNEDGEDGTFLQDAGRTQFVIFLSSLAEKMERVPALANFFVVEGGVHGERNLFVLLDALLPYLTHDCSAPGWTHRRDTCRYALSAVVSLAKCPDPWIQDLVGKEDRVASRTLMAARTTLLTLCKIPDNDDSATQVLFLRDVLRFWATLTTMSPTVAEDLQLAALINKEFYFQTLMPLLQSSDTHVYSAACLVTVQLLCELNGNAPVLTRGLANALLGTSIRKSSGHIIPHANHYDSIVTEDGAYVKGTTRVATTLGQQEEAAVMLLQVHPTTSFFLYYILPHLSSNPYMSAEERENSALLGYSTTRWSAVKATLMLVRALAENVPEVFLREVFLMDINSLADVLRKQRLSTGTATTGAAKEKIDINTNTHDRAADTPTSNLGLWSTAGAPPNLEVHDYYVKELHEATVTSAVLGLQAGQVGEAVLVRMLRTEGNMSIDALRARQEVMSAMARLDLNNAAPAEGVKEDKAKASAASSGLANNNNCWSHAGVQRSPLTVALCEMLQHLDATPFTVSSLVTDLVVSLCVLPDLRVIYTLLDPVNGPLKTALCQLRDVLQHRINAKGVEVALTSVTTRAAGATAASSTSARTSLNSPPHAATAAPEQTRLSLLILYDTLLQHWDDFTGEDGVMSRESSPSAPRGGAAEALSRGVLGAGFSVESLRGAVEANSNVLHACLYSEYLLAHLDAVIGYSALSQNLMYLQTSL